MPSLPRPTRDPSRCHAGPACRRPFSPVPRLPLSRCPADTRAPLVSSFSPAETPASLLRPRRASLPRGPSRASQGHSPAAHLFWKFLPSSAHLKSWNEIRFPRAVTTAAILAGNTHGHARPRCPGPLLNGPAVPAPPPIHPRRPRTLVAATATRSSKQNHPPPPVSFSSHEFLPPALLGPR